MSFSLLASQLIAAIVLFVATLAVGVLPTWIGKKLLAKSPCTQGAGGSPGAGDHNVIQAGHFHHQHDHQHNHNHNQIVHHHSPESTRGYISENQPQLAPTAFGKKILSFLMNLGGEYTCVILPERKNTPLVMNEQKAQTNYFILDFPSFYKLSFSFSPCPFRIML